MFTCQSVSHNLQKKKKKTAEFSMWHFHIKIVCFAIQLGIFILKLCVLQFNGAF